MVNWEMVHGGGIVAPQIGLGWSGLVASFDSTLIRRQKMRTRRPARSLAFEQLEMRLTLSTVTATTSTNWSGYAVTATAGTVSYVAGTWTVPTVTASSTSKSGYCAVWVGIDG
jgi:hypothetical protein